MEADWTVAMTAVTAAVLREAVGIAVAARVVGVAVQREARQQSCGRDPRPDCVSELRLRCGHAACFSVHAKRVRSNRRAGECRAAGSSVRASVPHCL